MQIIKSVWDFFQYQILGMKWLNDLLADGLAALGLNGENRWVGSLQFFLYDVIKITILLCLLIFIISYIQSYFPPERSKKILGRFHGLGARSVAALLGTVTPFCSCSSIPLFIGFSSAGLPVGVTFSFLISSPMVDLGSLLLLTSIFGAKVAVVYVLVGLTIAVAGGTLIEKLRMEQYVEGFILRASGGVDIESPDLSRKDRLSYAKDQMLATFKKVFPFILIGVGIGAVIHNWIPEDWIAAALGSKNPFGVVLATLVGVPMYADIFGTIPIAEALFAKGAQLGSILAFMMAVTTLSLPSMIMLRKAVKPKLLALFIVICTVGSSLWDICSTYCKRLSSRRIKIMAKKWYPIIDYPVCAECGACINKCPHGVYDIAKVPSPVVLRPTIVSTIATAAATCARRVRSHTSG
jgi:uncharacterized membrane protein YraQ (UPF0718 family)